jgi:acetyltransferase
VHRERKTGAGGEFIDTERVIGVSRYVTNPDTKSCEFSLLVADDFAGQGLGSRLMLSIIEFARNKGLAQIEGLILANNGNMLKLMRNLGFQIKAFEEDLDFRLAVKAL